MLGIPPVLIAYASWLVFVLTWNVFDRPATTVATLPARRERLHSLVISLGLVLLVLAPATLVKGRMWVNPPLLDWTMLLVMAAGIAWCWWARRHLGRLWSAAVMRKEAHRVVDNLYPQLRILRRDRVYTQALRRHRMNSRITFSILIAALAVAPGRAETPKLGPLTIKEQGSFFVGGENKTITQPGFGPNAPQTGRDHRQSDVRAVPDSDERRPARAGRDGARLLP